MMLRVGWKKKVKVIYSLAGLQKVVKIFFKNLIMYIHFIINSLVHDGVLFFKFFKFSSTLIHIFSPCQAII